MPGNKRWYLEPTENGILLYRDGKKAYYKAREGNRLIGPIKEVINGAEISQARSFKPYAIEVNIASLYVATVKPIITITIITITGTDTGGVDRVASHPP